MPRCPACRCSFRVMEDEDDGQHDCPRCGYSSHRPKCLWCGDPMPEPDDCEGDYCSTLCATYAERDSLEDSDDV